MGVTKNVLILLLAAALLATPGDAQRGPVGGDSIGATRRNAVVRAVERVQPSVVSISVHHRERVYYRYRDPFLEYFFGPRSSLGPLYAEDRDKISGGSGFIVEGGKILTNAHVLGDQEPTKVEIALMDGRVLEARAGQPDPLLDLAVLEVDEAGLPVAPLGDSGDILVGEWAIAIGNPFDLGPTVSIGVISALDRDFQERQGRYYYRDMIQTDAAINHGNSGGPLVNAAGEVIGINSFIYPGGGERGYDFGSIGIGFAIPIDAAKRFLDEIRVHGRVRQPWHGIVDLHDLTDRLADYLGLESTQGALITQIAADSPAFGADLAKGDVIVAINGETVDSADDARAILRQLRVGQECRIQVSRHGRDREIVFTVAERRRTGSKWN